MAESNGVQTSDELNENTTPNADGLPTGDNTSGAIEPGKDALEIQAAKEKRFAAAGDTVQGQEQDVNIA